MAVIYEDISKKFLKQLEKQKPDIQKAVKLTLDKLGENPKGNALRLHPITGSKPLLWKVDVLSNHSWQIVGIRKNQDFIPIFLSTHKRIDRRF